MLATSCPAEWAELTAAHSQFRISRADIPAPGGNESRIPKQAASLLRPKGWFETRIRGDLVVTVETHADEGVETAQTRIEDFMDGHKVDFVKHRVAFDLE